MVSHGDTLDEKSTISGFHEQFFINDFVYIIVILRNIVKSGDVV